MILWLLCPLWLHAQGSALAKIDKLLGQAALAQPSVVAPVIRQTPQLPSRTLGQWTQLENTVHRQIIPVQQAPVINYAQRKTARQQYQEVMQQFLQFKKEADIFLYYQTAQNSHRALPPEETRQWLERIYQTHQQLGTLRGVIRAEDIPLKRAYQYLNELLVKVSPELTPFTVPQIHFKRTDRVYKAREFFLYAPLSTKRIMHALRNFRSAKPNMPQGLQIAIFNDYPVFVSQFIRWYQQQLLFPDQHVIFFDDASLLLSQIQQGYIRPDVIITDILSDRGIGGIVLAQELRNSKYNGAIIALSAYEEKDISGPLFMSYGFDGMISNPKNDTTPELRQRMNQALENYFYYRGLHGWSR